MELKFYIVKVIAGGRVTLPKKVREKQGICEGDFVEIQGIRKITTTEEA